MDIPYIPDNVTMADNITIEIGSSSISGAYIVGFTVAYFIIGLTGIIGNGLVVYVIFTDSKMRHSLTNMLIVNLAIADSIILIFGIPEIVQFMMDKGWIIGDVLCKFQRTLLVVALYVSVMTLVALCIERYVAIVFPIKAHLLCTRRHTLAIIIIIWILAFGFGSITTLFNQVVPSPGNNLRFCRMVFPGDEKKMFLIFKYVESALFYILPLIIQLICYIVIGKQLFRGLDELHQNASRDSRAKDDSRRLSETLKARRGVVKMLIASVSIYFLSYSPHQGLLFYNTFSTDGFHGTWVYLVCVTILAYINSAANPILYCIFSENFRRHFGKIIFCFRFFRPNSPSQNDKYNVQSLNSEYTILLRRSTLKKEQYGISSV